MRWMVKGLFLLCWLLARASLAQGYASLFEQLEHERTSGLPGSQAQRMESAQQHLQSQAQLLELKWAAEDALKTSTYLRARETASQGLVLAKRAAKPQAAGEFHKLLARALEGLGNYSEAITHYRQALAAARKDGDPQIEAEARLDLGRVALATNANDEARIHTEAALAYYRIADDPLNQAVAQVNLAAVFASSGEYFKALELFRSTLPILRDQQDYSALATALADMGSVYWTLGRYTLALEAMQQARIIFSALGNVHESAKVAGNLAAVYTDVGLYDEAHELADLTLKNYRASADRHGQAFAEQNLGVIAWHRKEIDAALAHFVRAAEGFAEVGDLSSAATATGNQGMTHWKAGRLNDAMPALRRALEIHAEQGQTRLETLDIANIGRIALDSGNPTEALRRFQAALRILGPSPYPELAWRTHHGRGLTLKALERTDAAIAAFEQSLQLIEALRANLYGDTLRQSLMGEDKYTVYDDYIELLEHLHWQHQDKDYDRRALEIFERKQARLMLDQVFASDAHQFKGVPEALLRREQELHAKLNSLEFQATPYAHAAPYDAVTSANQKARLSTQIAQLDLELARDFPRYHALRHPKPVTVEQLQQKLLNDGEFLLIYHVAKSRSLLWVVGRTRMQLFRLSPGIKALSKVVQQARSLLLDGDLDTALPRLLRKVYRSLLPADAEPLLAEAGQIFVVPSGPLYYLPFGSLPINDAPAPPRYWIERQAIAYLSSASLLKARSSARRNDADSGRYPFIAFADPVYSDESGTLPTLGISKLQTTNTAFDDGFYRLPGTATEARVMARLLNSPPASDPLQLRERASRSQVLKLSAEGLLDNYRVVLFACHGWVPDDVTPITPASLVLSHPQRNGILTMADVYSLRLDADLVLLSACDSGMGPLKRGEGIIGLTRAFMYAGAKSVVVTLRQVDSEAAERISSGVATGLQQGMNPAEAMRFAKQRMLASPISESFFRHPLAWDAFVVFGAPTGIPKAASPPE